MTNEEFLQVLKDNKTPSDEFIRKTAPTVLSFYLKHHTAAYAVLHDGTTLASNTITVLEPNDEVNIRLAYIAYMAVRKQFIND